MVRERDVVVNGSIFGMLGEGRGIWGIRVFLVKF